MKLAAHMKCVDVDGMLHQITPQEFTEWMAANNLDGVLESDRSMYVIALAFMRLFRMLGDKKVELKDLLPWIEQEAKAAAKVSGVKPGQSGQVASPRQAAAIFSMWAAQNIPASRQPAK